MTHALEAPLATAAELHAWLAGRHGGPWHQSLRDPSS
jgi:hypothetical protein